MENWRKAERIHQEIAAAGIPVTGVSRQGESFTVSYREVITPQQRAAVAQIIARVQNALTKDRAAQRADIGKLKPQQRDKLLDLVLAEIALEKPWLLTAAGIELDGG